MSANWEMQLLSSIVRDGSPSAMYEDAQRRSVRSECFETPEGRAIWSYVHAHYNRPTNHGYIPSETTLREMFPNTDFPTPLENFVDLCEKVVLRHMRSKVDKLLEKYTNTLRDSTASVPMAVQDLLSGLETVKKETKESTDVSFRDTIIPGMIELLTRVRENNGLTGMPWPWDVMNENTQGIQPTDFILMWAMPKMMKCVKSGLIMTRSGERLDISALPAKTEVTSYTDSTGRVRWATADRVESGTKECVRVTTSSGRVAETSTEHYFMVPEGSFEGTYERIQDLHPGDYVAMARTCPEWEPTNSLSPAEAWTLGALTGAGSLSGVTPRFSSPDCDVVRQLTSMAPAYGCTVRPLVGRHSFSFRHLPGTRNGVTSFLTAHELMGKEDWEKEVPARVYTSTREAIAAYLAGLFETAGLCSGVGKHNVATFCAAGRKLTEGVQHLLLRMGINSALRCVTSKAGNVSFYLYVYAQASQYTLLTMLSPYMVSTPQKNALRLLAERNVRQRLHNDNVPFSARLRELIYREKGTQPWPTWRTSATRLTPAHLYSRSGCTSRYLLNLLADAWDSDALRKEANTDIVWEKIVSIEPIGRHACYDICITDGQDPNFVLGSFVVHNTFIGLVVCAYLYQQNYRVLIYSKEMTQEILWNRLACIICRVDYKRFKTGQISDEEQLRMFEQIERLTGARDDGTGHRGEIFFTQADRMDGGPGGPAEIRRKIEMYEPDLVFLDSSYMLEMPGSSNANALDWKALAAITRELKSICKTKKVPMIAIMQENEQQALKFKGSRGTASVAMNKTAIADCDIGLRLVLNKKAHELSIHFAVCREAEADGFTINALACENFEFAGMHLHYVGDDIEAAKAEDKVKGGHEQAAEATEPANGQQGASTTSRIAGRYSVSGMRPQLGRPSRVLPVMPPTPSEAVDDADDPEEAEDEEAP